MRGRKGGPAMLSGSRRTNRGQGSHPIISRHLAIQVKTRAKIKPTLSSSGVLLVIARDMREN
jgi:hypothetical protein